MLFACMQSEMDAHFELVCMHKARSAIDFVLFWCAGSVLDDSYAMLRARSVPQPSGTHSTILSPASGRSVAREAAARAEVEDLNQRALSMGFTICPITSIAQAIGRAMASRTRSREGSMVYQTTSFSVPAISRQAASHLFPQSLLHEETSTRATWMATSVPEVLELAGPLMEKSGYACVGVTRALKTNSERWSRVVAHIIPQVQVTHSSMRNQLMIDFQYVLLDESGEMHPPKDFNRNEMNLSPLVVSAARSQIRADLLQMLERKLVRLSPTFLRHLGMAQQAMLQEAQMAQLSLQPARGRGSRVPLWEVSHVVEERGRPQRREYLVEWAGYHPSWEAWRMNGPGGAVGTPLQTWEPAKALAGTEALQRWLEAQESAWP